MTQDCPADHAGHIRPARLSDTSSLAALAIEVWLGTYIRQGVNAFFADYALATYTPDKYRHAIKSEQDQIFVSENTVGIDGFIHITHDKAAPTPGCSDTEITTLYVQPRHHRRGIGRSLLHTGLRYCSDHHAPRPWLAVNAENTAAIKFYAVNGFHQTGQTHFRIQDQAYLNYIMAYAPALAP